MKKFSQGMTLIEIIVVVSIGLAMMVALTRFISIGYPLSKITYLQVRSTESARLQLKRMAKALRELRDSDTGAYPLVETSPQRIIFYSDVDADDTTERIRYELSGTDLIRGITKPSGNPLEYDTDNEEETVISRSIQNGSDPIFIYYSGDYPADTTELTPTDLTEVKYIQFRLLVDPDPGQDPGAAEIVSQVQLRNLKTNLGETVEE